MGFGGQLVLMMWKKTQIMPPKDNSLSSGRDMEMELKGVQKSADAFQYYKIMRNLL